LDFSVRTSSSGSIFYPIAKNISYCDMWYDTNQMAACYMSISKEGIGYYASYKGGRPKYCYAHGTDQSHIVHKICQRDTGKSESQGNCREEYCVYSY